MTSLYFNFNVENKNLGEKKMLNAIEIAKIFGPIYVIWGIWALLYQDNSKKVLESISKNLSTLYIVGIVNLIVGLFIINAHSHWSLHLSVLVTILGWAIFLEGLIFFFVPNLSIKLYSVKRNILVLYGLVAFIWGLALMWLAYK